MVGVRISTQEAADMDVRKGSLSRTEWLRYLMLRARKENVSVAPQPPQPPPDPHVPFQSWVPH